jgi:cation transport ATPase
MNQLPEGYKEIRKVDLTEDKKTFFVINIFSFIIFIAMAVLCAINKPISFTVDSEFLYLLILAVFLYIIYIILHEAIHEYFMNKFSGIKAYYGHARFCAYAGSDAYFNKKHYIIILLAPVVILGTVLFIINAIVPQSYFWIIYFVQIGNLTGAVGDLYVTYLMSKMPDDTLIQDTGVSMTMHSKQL